MTKEELAKVIREDYERKGVWACKSNTINMQLDFEMLGIILEALEEEPSEDAISRQAVLEAVKKNTFRLTFAEEQGYEGHVAWSAEAVYSDVIEGALLELPSVNPQPKTGHWIRKTNDYGASSYMCSECGRWHPIYNHSLGFDYCNGCGARMVEPQESEG